MNLHAALSFQTEDECEESFVVDVDPTVLVGVVLTKRLRQCLQPRHSSSTVEINRKLNLAKYDVTYVQNDASLNEVVERDRASALSVELPDHEFVKLVRESVA